MVSILLGVWCVEWRWCVLLLVHPVQCAWPMPSTPGAVLGSTAIMSRAVPLPDAVVCAVCVSVVGCPLSRSPLTVVVGGGIVDGGVA